MGLRAAATGDVRLEDVHVPAENLLAGGSADAYADCVRRARLETMGAGETQPVASNSTDAGRQQNRRVEVALYANEDYRRQVEPDYPPEDFAAPEGIVWATVDPTTGRPAAQGITLPFVNGTAPNATAEIPLDAPVGSEGEDLLKQIF